MCRTIRYGRQVNGLNCRSGFTLIEALVIVVILAILLAILLPVFQHPRDNGRVYACQSNLKQIAVALFEYAEDYDDTWPRIINGPVSAHGHTASWRRALHPYLRTAEIWRCPSNPINGHASPYDWMPQSYDVVDTGPIRPHAPAHQGDVAAPATTITVFEENGDTPQAQRIGVPWDLESTAAGWANILWGRHYLYDTNLILAEKRVAASNILFADGHVKQLRLRQTVANGVNMWHLHNADPVTLGAMQKLQAVQQSVQ